MNTTATAEHPADEFPQVEPDPGVVERLTDIYIPEDPDPDEALKGAYFHDGGGHERSVLATGLGQWVLGLYTRAKADHPERVDFDLHWQGFSIRGHRQQTVEGLLLNFRILGKEPPLLEELHLPPYWRELFTAQAFERGGLFVIAGETGMGKSTTAAALIRTWLYERGGHCLAIEDPPEFRLHGRHRCGRCVQTPVGEGGYPEAIRAALRAYPTATAGGGIMLVGECRDAESAAMLVQNAVNGFRVVTTVHAGDPIEAIQRILSLASRNLGGETEGRHLLASGLRLVASQRLRVDGDGDGWSRGMVSGQLLVSQNFSSGVADRIKHGRLSEIGAILEFQQKHLANSAREKKLIADVIAGLAQQ